MRRKVGRWGSMWMRPLVVSLRPSSPTCRLGISVSPGSCQSPPAATSSERVAVAQADSYTLNFSRPASGVFVQYYKFHRLGIKGYKALTENRMANAKYLRDAMKNMLFQGKPRFVILDAGDTNCLPVVAAYLNPALKLAYDDIDLQHTMMGHHWYVSGYKMSFLDPATEESRPLFKDAPASQTMFRVVVKANVTRSMMDHLITSLKEVLEAMDSLGAGFQSMHQAKKSKHHHSGHVC
mmetsp:Transcript_122710/g.261873  ORF Transcript_122710/g.261873 Transcript_122710/m.261873 type:complete len:237 (-) Transcript_122710:75-785(-)